MFSQSCDLGLGRCLLTLDKLAQLTATAAVERRLRHGIQWQLLYSSCLYRLTVLSEVD